MGRPDPKAVEDGVTRLLESLLQFADEGTLVFESDEHPAYPRAMRKVIAMARTLRPKLSIHHGTTSSRTRRTKRNPLFPVNLADLLLRHCQANHRRETIAFSKRRMAAISRAQVFRVWRNWIKRRRENGGPDTAAMYVGLERSPLDWNHVFRERLFPAHASLTNWQCRYYVGAVWTRVLGTRQRSHKLVRAF
ncbi:MAG: hypothetical protein R3E97_21150 [Candidatus Eisenbacteria bacterium]